MKRALLLFSAVLAVGSALAITLEQIPTDSAWPNGKQIINRNTTATGLGVTNVVNATEVFMLLLTNITWEYSTVLTNSSGDTFRAITNATFQRKPDAVVVTNTTLQR